MHLPPAIAAVVYLSITAWFFTRDLKERPNVTSAIWLPFFWVVISGGRFFSEWLDLLGIGLLGGGGGAAEGGNLVDALIFFLLIGRGLLVLSQRRVDWGEFMRRNQWVTIYLAYCLIACAWSDYPFVSFKRWIKLFGQPVMVLLIMTEPDPMEAFTRVMKRCAYFIIPISLLFIKYYPEYGRQFDAWSGAAMNTGITTNKNTLGCDCFILGVFFFWHTLRVWDWEPGPKRKKELRLSLFFLFMDCWLLSMAHSSTSIGVMVLASVMMLFVGFKFIDRRNVTTYLVGIISILVVSEMVFDLHKTIIKMLGRNEDLTGRTDIWQILLHWDLNPLLGAGFEGFWFQERVDHLADIFGGLQLNEAHNGYLETYINLGFIGLVITIGMILATYFKSQRALIQDYVFGRFRLAYLAAFLVYNWTEAAFRTHCVPFFLFFLVAIDYPRPTPEPVQESVPEVDTESVHKSDMSPNGSTL